MQKPNRERLAAIDMGTNSFHLAIVEASEAGRFEVLSTDKEMVRLGTGGGDLDDIQPDAMDRGIETLKRFASIARGFQATIRAVATSAVREARNKVEFLERVRKECQIEVEVITGLEEARLIYLGILQSLPVYEKKILMIDIGGGSTELLIGYRGQPVRARSFKLGAIRLTDRFFTGDPITGDQVEQCRKFLQVQFTGALDGFHHETVETIIGSSGTIETLYEMIRLKNGTQTPAAEQAIHAEDLDAIVKTITRTRSRKDRAALPGLDKKRADIIVGGAILLQEIFHYLNIRSLRVSSFALREGVILDSLLRKIQSPIDFVQLRTDSVRRLMDKHLSTFKGEVESSFRTARFCRTIFSDLKTQGLLQNVPDADRELLEYSALLHNTGINIAYSAHHKHSYYLVKNSDQLTGFSPMEREIIAQVARYHRKKTPSKKHSEFAALPPDAQGRVKTLSAILRFAVALDRGRTWTGDILIENKPEHVSFKLQRDDLFSVRDDSQSIELWSVQMNQFALEEVLGKSVVVTNYPPAQPQLYSS